MTLPPFSTVHRFRVTWSGLTGLPGVSTFYCSVETSGTTDVQFVGYLKTFFEALKTYVPSPCKISYPSQSDIIRIVDGELVGTAAFAPPADTTMSDTGGYAAPTGVFVKWLTNDVINGHRVAGRTFIVPSGGGLISTSGTPATVFRTALQTAASALVTSSAGNFVVYVKKVPARTGHDELPGKVASVTSSIVPNKFTVLRSRRD